LFNYLYFIATKNW